MFSSHKTVTITTTAFKIDLIDPAIGMKLFTSHSNTPTTIKTINTCSNGINLAPFSSQADTPPVPSCCAQFLACSQTCYRRLNGEEICDIRCDSDEVSCTRFWSTTFT